jgi:multiple antibiotic resistance protein
MQLAVNAFLLGFPALFSIVNPPSVAFIFREVTAGRGRDERGRLARKVAFFSFLVLGASLWIGSYVLAFFGITLAALRIAGGLVVAVTAWDLLTAPERREARKQEQAADAGDAEDIAFYPLTVPLTTGPGSISVAVALGAGRSHLESGAVWFFLGMTAAAVALAMVIWASFGFADTVVSRLGPSGSRIVTRLFAFLLLCIGVQILLTGVEGVLEPLLVGRG